VYANGSGSLFIPFRRIKAAKEHVPAGVSAWGPLSAKHGVAKESGLALGAKRQKLANTEPPRKSHKKKFPEAPQTKQKSQHSNSTQQKVDLDPNELIKLPNQQTTSAPSIASSPTPTNSNAPVALVWASYDSGHQVEDTDFTRRLPCPFSKCNTFHCGFDELEHHLRKSKCHPSLILTGCLLLLIKSSRLLTPHYNYYGYVLVSCRSRFGEDVPLRSSLHQRFFFGATFQGQRCVGSCELTVRKNVLLLARQLVNEFV
jgi:hypothetical protein